MNGTVKVMIIIKQRKFQRTVIILHLRPLDVMGKDGKCLRARCLGDCEDIIRISFLFLFIA